MIGPVDSFGQGTIAVTRRSFFKQVMRSYDVVIDGVVVGRVWAIQTAHFPVDAGTHVVKLTVGRTMSSDDVTVDVRPGETRVVRTRFGGFRKAFHQAMAITEFTNQLPGTAKTVKTSSWYEGPWITLKLEDRT